MPAVYFFLIDVSMNAVQTGATAAACSAIAQAISDLPVISMILSVCFKFFHAIWCFIDCHYDY